MQWHLQNSSSYLLSVYSVLSTMPTASFMCGVSAIPRDDPKKKVLFLSPFYR